MFKYIATSVLSLVLLAPVAHADVLDTYSFETGTPNSTAGANPNQEEGLAGTFTEDLTTQQFSSWLVSTDGGDSFDFANFSVGGETLTIITNNLDSGLTQKVVSFGQTLILELGPIGEEGWGAGDNDGAFIETTANQYYWGFNAKLVSETGAVPEPNSPALFVLGLLLLMACGLYRNKTSL